MDPRRLTAPPPRRPWWKRKRVRAAAVLWLCLPMLYPFAAGPAFLAVREQWVATWADDLFVPALSLQGAPVIGDPYRRYLIWCFLLAEPSE